MENEKIAKRAVKIAMSCLFILLLIALLVIYILLNQIDSTAGISKRVEQLEKQVKIYHSNS